jgi:gluconate 5-dehydrogenase
LELFDLKGRRALVTGSGQGIGFALAQALARAGASLLLNGRNESRLRAAVTRLRDEGAEVAGVPFDVTDPKQAEHAIAGVEDQIGPIDILVNNAGIQRRQALQDFSTEAWREVMSTNLDSVFYVSQAVARRMIPRGRGKIINVASVQSEAARPGIAPYTASKGGVKNLTKGMCADWARHGLQINAIGPGYFDTPMNASLVADPGFDGWLRSRTPAGRWGKLEELHGAVIFLASQASDFVNGQTIYVDGGILAVL